MVKQRFLALDIMRGLTLALMILVNTPGSWNHIYAPLEHADWHGVTPTDFVFPFFLFMVGAALFYSLRAIQEQPRSFLVKKIAKRTAILFAIGVLLGAFPFMKPLHDWRILGVLQRIALAYGIAACLVVYCSPKIRWVIATGILLGYWGLLQLGQDPYSLEHSIVRQVDLALFGPSHLWQGKGIAFDPEGFLSTLPAVVNVLLGLEAVAILNSSPSRQDAIKKLLLLGGAFIALALLWNMFFPINKSLWTSPFVLLTVGVGIWVLVGLVLLENTAIKPLLQPFTALGMNPLFIYCMASIGATILWMIPVNGTSAYNYGFEFLGQFFAPNNASLIFALINVAFYFSIALWLQRKKIVFAL